MSESSAMLNALEQDVENAAKLVALMEDEFRALQERDLSALDKALGEKQAALDLLNRSANHRTALLASKGLPPSREGLRQFARELPDCEHLVELADRLSDLLKQCRDNNQRNGQMIQANQTFVKGLLNVIQGSDEVPALYNNHGSTTHSSRMNPLTKA